MRAAVFRYLTKKAMSSLSEPGIPDTPVVIYLWGPRQRLPLVPPVWRYLIYAVWRYCYCKQQKSILEVVYTRCKYCGSSCIVGSSSASRALYYVWRSPRYAGWLCGYTTPSVNLLHMQASREKHSQEEQRRCQVCN